MAGSIDGMNSGGDRSYDTTAGGDDQDEVVVIEADIRQTQDRLGNTVEEIGERFNPQRLKQQLQGELRDATIGRVEHMAQNTVENLGNVQRTMMSMVRDNPVPMTMIGLGLGWLIWNGTRKSSGSQQGDGMSEGMGDGQSYGRNYGQAGASTGFDDYEDSMNYGDSMDTGSSYLSDSQSSMGDRGTMDQMRDKAGNAMDAIKDKASGLADSAQNMGSTVADQTRTQARRVQNQFQENPLAIGAAALALGLVGGLLIPATQKENELVGETRDQLVDKVRDVAQDTKQKAQQVAERVMDEAQHTAKDAAQQVGLMSS